MKAMHTRAGVFARCVAVAGVIMAGGLLAEFMRSVGRIDLRWPDQHLLYVLDSTLRILGGTAALVALLVVIEGLTWTGWRRVAATVGGALLAVPIASWATVYASPFDIVFLVGSSASPAALFWYYFWRYTVAVVLCIVALHWLRRHRASVERLDALQERSRSARQRLAQSRLQAIQARIDPQLLFDMLAAVRRFYASDAVRAEALLDELSLFLRAALPRLRSPRSTLEIEFALVASWLRLRQTAAGADASPALVAQLPAELAAAAFPAGVLLPLVSAATPAAAAARPIALAAQATPGTTRVVLGLGAAPDIPTLERLRAALADLHGDRASLAVSADAGGARVEVEVPDESA